MPSTRKSQVLEHIQRKIKRLEEQLVALKKHQGAIDKASDEVIDALYNYNKLGNFDINNIFRGGWLLEPSVHMLSRS